MGSIGWRAITHPKPANNLERRKLAGPGSDVEATVYAAAGFP